MKKTISISAVILVSIVLAFTVVELFFRLFIPSKFRLRGNTIVLPTNQEYLHHNPNAKKLDEYVTVRKNSIGFRGENPPKDFDEHITIVVLGGSTTEQLMITEGQTWIDEVGRRLEPYLKNVWINNAGIDGHSTFGHLQLFEQYIKAIRPNVALFLIGINDVYLGESNRYDVENGYSKRVYDSLTTKLFSYAERSEFLTFLQNMTLAYNTKNAGITDLVEISLSNPEVSDMQYFEKHEDIILEHEIDMSVLGIENENSVEFHQIVNEHQNTYVPEYKLRVVRLINESRGVGIEPVLITQPALYGDAVDPGSGVDLGKIPVNVGYHDKRMLTGKEAWVILELYNDVIRELSEEYDVYYIDLASKLDKNFDYYYDLVHFSKNGSQMVGKIVASELCPLLAEKYTNRNLHECNEL